MRKEKKRARALGIALIAVLGLTALMVSGAQASWLVEAKNIASNQPLEVVGHSQANLKVEKESGLEILCSVVEGIDLLLIAGTTEANGQLKYTTCKTWQNGKESPNCKPVEPIVMGGKTKLILHEAKNYLLFEPPVAGGNFTQIKFTSPCALPATNNLKGSNVIECAFLKEGVIVGENCSVERAVHLFRFVSSALFPEDVVLYGTKVSGLSGVVSVSLASGKTWAGHV